MLKSRTSSLATGPDESVEVVRRRALHRLVGSLVLVTLGVIGFPLVFDTEPRPIDPALQVNIPNKDTMPPMAAASERSAPAAAASETSAKPVDRLEVVTAPERAAPKAIQPSQSKADVATKPTPAKTPEVAKPQAAQSNVTSQTSAVKQAKDAARALAILQGKDEPAPRPASAEKWAVQVGSYGEASSVERVRAVLKEAGFASFTETVQTDKGALTRVRIGPFASEGEAASVIRKLRELGLATSIVKL